MLNVLRKILFRHRFNKLKQYILAGNSHFFPAFRMNLNQPVQDKTYLNVGHDSIVNCSVTFETPEGNVKIGNRSYIGEYKIICRSQVIIEDDVFIAWGGYIYDHDSHSLDYRDRENDIRQQLADYKSGVSFIANKNWDVVNSKPIRICSHAWVGLNCIILKGVTIGEGAIVGAGSVVTKDVAPWTVVGGNPARTIKVLPDNMRKKGVSL